MAKSAIWGCLSVLLISAHASPEVSFPFNAQVPTVARIGQAYNFVLSPTTFATTAGTVTYSLNQAPEWLSFDSATRRLSGTPRPSDEGASTFTLTGADSTGETNMACTLVVSADPAPRLSGDISSQLAATANLSSSYPPVVTILPSDSFLFNFERGAFIDAVSREIHYYATLADHSPLPSWLLFESNTLTFSGTAPQLSAFPQSWDVSLIISDVEGFAGTSSSFTIAVSTHQLAFVPERQTINIAAGQEVEFTDLRDTLFLNGEKMSPQDLSSAQVSELPDWLSFDTRTLAITGKAPSDVKEQNITIGVFDDAGNGATAFIALVTNETSLFQESLEPLTARAGEDFRHHFPNSLFGETDVDLTVDVPDGADWLSFDSETHDLSGEVPDQTSPSTIQATLTARAAATSEREDRAFSIQIRAANSDDEPSSSVISSRTASTNSPTASADFARGEEESEANLASGTIAAIVLALVIAVAIIIALLIFCWLRRRKRSYVQAGSPSKSDISRPIPPKEHNVSHVLPELPEDVEKTAGSEMQQQHIKPYEPPPQIALNLPPDSPDKKLRWTKRFSRASKVSSLGVGADAIRDDSNIPEWGGDSTALHGQHESFGVPAEIARSSKQLSDLSPGKRALKRLQQKRLSRNSVGLGIDTAGGAPVFLPRHSSRGAQNQKRRTASSALSVTQERSSQTSLSTRGTSVLSTVVSDFPRPPTRGSLSGSQLVIPEHDKRKSVRLVGRSDSVADTRSVLEKRQSYIRNRASSSFASPLYAHGSRKSSLLQNGSASGVASSMGSRMPSRRGKGHLNTYSESSSVDPTQDSKRFSTRIRSTFAPSFPRAVTKSTLGRGTDDDYYTTSSSISEADLATELALPRHQRTWVVPGEASPTPPPGGPTHSRDSSAPRIETPPGGSEALRQKWHQRVGADRSSSPLAKALAATTAASGPTTASSRLKARAHATRSAHPPADPRHRLSEPISLISNDSLHAGARLVPRSSQRPISVEKAQRLSSMKAETEDARPGSEAWEAMEGAGLMPPNSSLGREASGGSGLTGGSGLSGPAFL